MSCARSRHAARGFTLVELLIAVAIVGILIAIAYPSYRAQVIRSNRTEAKAALMAAVQELEKCYTRYGRYLPTAADLCRAYDDIFDGGRESENRKYLVTFQGAVAANTYTLQAALRPGQGMDAECGTLTIDQSGLRGRTGAAAIERCW